MTGFFVMENEKKKIQPNYEELKKQSELTDLFIKYANGIKIDDKDVPKTEKGRATKAKELIEKVNKKIEKVSNEEMNVYNLKKKRLKQSIKEDDELKD
jgi:hypothetical protein